MRPEYTSFTALHQNESIQTIASDDALKKKHKSNLIGRPEELQSARIDRRHDSNERNMEGRAASRMEELRKHNITGSQHVQKSNKCDSDAHDGKGGKQSGGVFTAGAFASRAVELPALLACTAHGSGATFLACARARTLIRLEIGQEPAPNGF